MTETSINRRDFLKIMGVSSGALVVGIYLGSCQPEQPAEQSPEPGTPDKPPDQKTLLPDATLEPNIYLKIDSKGTLTTTAFRSEMGQGVRTVIAMILAEELDAAWDRVVIEQAPADPAYGDQVTGGSASVSGNYDQLRMAGAAVRQLLLNTAAQVWDVDPSACTTAASLVYHPDGVQTLSYGELAGKATTLKLPQLGEFFLKPESEYKIIGTDVHHWDASAIVTGQAVYGLDFRLPGMLFAAIARCPMFGGSIASLDGSPATNIPGVKAVHVIDNWVAVVAENTWAALKGRDALQITWQGGDPDLSSASIRAELVSKAPEPGLAGEGKLEAVYEFPYQAHVPMEPMNCTAYVQGDMCEVWAPTQSAQDVQRAVQNALQLKREAVTVHVTLMGGGFGRRLQSDYAVEAAKVSRAVGAPVQVVWSRTDDIQHDFYHPLHYLYVHADPQENSLPQVRTYGASGRVPTGAWRSVGNHPEAYARECFLDEIAAHRDQDPLSLRREIYKGRALAVIELAAEKAGWGAPLPAGWGRGIAYHATFGVTHVAMVAEVAVNSDQIRVQRVVCGVDCGLAINPDNVAAQMEGGIAFGLTAALKAGVTVEAGRIKESNFHDCPLLQIGEMPQVDVYIINSSTHPSGIGEMGVPPIAPAVANAVFNATGVRVRHLPIRRQDLD